MLKLYWGNEDGGNDQFGWDNVVDLGQRSKVPSLLKFKALKLQTSTLPASLPRTCRYSFPHMHPPSLLLLLLLQNYLELYYNFDDGSEDVVTDSSGKERDGSTERGTFRGR